VYLSVWNLSALYVNVVANIFGDAILTS
jgi:hypothetical protein